MAGKPRMAARSVRMARLLVGRNTLRRPTDRLEGMIVALLCAAFLAALAAAPSFGQWLYQTQRASAARLHPATAVLIQSTPPSGGYMTSEGTALARWRAPDGREEKGVLTTLTAPAISGGGTAGTQVQVWLTGSGQPVPPPVTSAETMLSATILTAGAVIGTSIALLTCYALCRFALDRRRRAAWASEWQLIGPKWKTSL
jgi:hypothetical protein